MGLQPEVLAALGATVYGCLKHKALDGLPSYWEPRVDDSTDENGWQYASSAGATMWSNAFDPISSFVRRRCLVAESTQEMRMIKLQTSPPGRAERTSPSPAPAGKKEDSPVPGASGGNALLAMDGGVTEMIAKYGDQVGYVLYCIEGCLFLFEQYKNMYNWRVSTISTVMCWITALLLLLSLFVPTRWIFAYLVASFFFEGWYEKGRKQATGAKLLTDLRRAVSDAGADAKIAAKWTISTPLKDVLGVISPRVLAAWVSEEYAVRCDLRTVQRDDIKRIQDLAIYLGGRGVPRFAPAPRDRVWWSYTFANFLDHVPTEKTSLDL